MTTRPAAAHQALAHNGGGLPHPGVIFDAATLLDDAGIRYVEAPHPAGTALDPCDWPLCWRGAVTTGIDGSYCAVHGGAS